MASNTPLKSPQSNGSLELKTAAISSPVSAATGTPKTPVQSAALTPNTTPNSLKVRYLKAFLKTYVKAKLMFF